jgi:N utilization substance protein B
MKTSQDPRHKKRIEKMQKLFSVGFPGSKKDSATLQVRKSLPAIDEAIAAAAPEWPIDKIAKIDLAILRLSIYELTVAKTEPPKVIIDEAVEIAKEFGNENSPKFVNGVLGTILKGATPASL